MRKKFVAALIVFVAILIGAFIFWHNARGAGPFFFGGKVVGTPFYCTCSGNFLVTISPPAPAVLSYYMGSQGYLNYNLPQPGIWALGLYTPGAVCMVYVGKGCAENPIQPIGVITPMTGTSIAF